MPDPYPKLIATDIDGTVVSDEGLVHEKTIAAYGEVQALGVMVVPFTGRSPLGAMNFLGKNVNLMKYRPFPGAYHHGGIVFGPDGIDDVVLEVTLSRDLMRLGFGIGEKLPGCAVFVSGLTQLFTDRHDDQLREFLAMYREPVAQVFDNFLGFFEANRKIKLYHLTIFHPEIGRAASLRSEAEELVKSQGGQILLANPRTMDILPAGVNKANALKALVKRLGICLDDVVALGDAENDIQILKLVKNSVSMGNATPVVKESAAMTTSSCSDGGWGEAVRKFVA